MDDGWTDRYKEMSHDYDIHMKSIIMRTNTLAQVYSWYQRSKNSLNVVVICKSSWENNIRTR